MRKQGCVFLSQVLLCCVPVLGQTSDQAQTPVPVAVPSSQVQQAELAIPFGVVSGRLIPSGDYLIFVDDQRPEASFVVPRTDIQDFKFESGTMILSLRNPIRDRTGDRTNLSLRLLDPAGAEPIVTWARVRSGSTQAASQPATQTVTAANAASTTGSEASNAAAQQTTQSAAQTPGEMMRYQVKHNHRIGSCNGTLVVTPSQLIFESITEVNDSRRWSFRDVKELNHANPYELKVIPFVGNEYNFEFGGTPMGNNEYRALVGRVTAARSAQ